MFYCYIIGIRSLLYVRFSILTKDIFLFSIQQTFKARFTKFRAIENPSMRATAKLLRAQAREQQSKFCEQIEQKPNFASTGKFQGTI